MPGAMSIGRSLLLNVLVALGIAISWLVFAMWMISMFSGLWGGTYETIYVRLDGEPLLYRYSTRPYGQLDMLTLDGQPTDTDMQQLLFSTPIYPQKASFVIPLVAKGWDSRLAAVNDGRTPPTYWYLVHDGRTNGRAYGVGYNSLTRQIVGYFGRQGFADQRPPRDEWFEVAGSTGLHHASSSVATTEPITSLDPRMVLLAEGKLWAFNTQTRKVEVLLEAPRATSLGQVWKALDTLPETKPGTMPLPAQYVTRQNLLLRSADDCTIVDVETGNKTTFVVPPAMRKVPFSGYELADGHLLLISDQGTVEKLGQRLVWLASDGTVLRERNVELPQLARSSSSNATLAWGAVSMAPWPLAFVLLALFQPLEALSRGTAETYSAGMLSLIQDAWSAMLLVVAIGIVLAVAAYRRQRRFGLPHAAAWAAFVFVFGIPGWLAYRFHRIWPTLEDCPSCGQPAPRDREACLDCGASFPPPPLKGIEVFA